MNTTTATALGKKKTAWLLEREARESVAAMVRTTLYLLGRISVDPREVDTMRERLASGVVLIRFFAYSNPATLFELPVGSADLQRIQAAVEANIDGRMFDAASRVLQWRASPKSWGRGRQEDAVLDKMRATMTWPDRDEWSRDAAWAGARRNALMDLLSAKLTVVRDRRNQRLAMLSSAAAPGVGSWTELLEAIATHAAGQIH